MNGEVQFYNERAAVPIKKVEVAGRIKVTFRASKSYQSRKGSVVFRLRTTLGQKWDWKDAIGFEIIACLFKRYPILPEQASPTAWAMEGSIRGAP